MLYITVCTVSLVTGILVLQNDRQSKTNHAFFAIVVSLIVWTLGLTVSTVASTMAIAILGQRISSFGWANIYVVLIIFILRLTGHRERHEHYVLFIPTVLLMIVYGLPLNLYAYNLEFSPFGWLFTSTNTFWDYVFYVYFTGYTLLSLFLLIAWKTETEKHNTASDVHIHLPCHAAEEDRSHRRLADQWCKPCFLGAVLDQDQLAGSNPGHHLVYCSDAVDLSHKGV